MAHNVKKSLRRAVRQLPRPDAQALWNQPVTPMAEHDYITRQEQPQRRHTARRTRGLISACACMLLAFMGGFGWYAQNLVASTVIDLDVNPSIEITTNRRDKVLSVTALNEEARLLLEGRDYKGWAVTDTVETLSLSLQKGGYLSESRNAVLLSVSSEDEAHALALSQELSDKIRLSVDRAESPTAVLRQTARLDADLRTQAQARHSSAGKLRLAIDLSARLAEYSPEQLLALPLETLLEVVELLGSDAPKSLIVDASRFAKPPAQPGEVAPEIAPVPTPKESTSPSVITPPPTAPTTPARPSAPAAAQPSVTNGDDDDGNQDDDGDDNSPSGDDNSPSGDDDNGDDLGNDDNSDEDGNEADNDDDDDNDDSGNDDDDDN